MALTRDRWPAIEEHAENSLVVPGSLPLEPRHQWQALCGGTENLHAILNVMTLQCAVSGDCGPPQNTPASHDNVALSTATILTLGDSGDELIWVVHSQIEAEFTGQS